MLCRTAHICLCGFVTRSIWSIVNVKTLISAALIPLVAQIHFALSIVPVSKSGAKTSENTRRGYIACVHHTSLSWIKLPSEGCIYRSVVPPVTFLHSHFIFYQKKKTLLYFSLSACFAGECKGPKGGEMCGNSLSVRPDPTGGRQSAAISTEVSIFYFCGATHPKTMHPHTHWQRERETKWQVLLFIWAPFSNQTLVPLYFLPVSKLCYHQCQHHPFCFFSVELSDSLPSEWGCRWEWSNKGDNGHVSLEQAGQAVLFARQETVGRERDCERGRKRLID